MPKKYDITELKEFRDNLEKLDVDVFVKSCCNELASRLLRKVKKRTPVGIYPAGSGKTGGTLRRNWYIENHVSVNGKEYKIDVYNNTHYAPYVEYGHRTRNGNGWVNGRFMLTESENELRGQVDSILKRKLDKALKDLMK